mmetsp:Transcript_1695/g.3749  ORF Transcript_1695/g.3749 Transcript_1695/m.3749 type:complete len:435 (-) Transcript_1695:362-1666(-)
MPPREHLAELGSERSEAQPNATQHDDGLKHLHRVYCCEGAKAQAQCGCGEGAQAVDADSHLEHRGQDKAHARSVQAWQSIAVQGEAAHVRPVGHGSKHECHTRPKQAQPRHSRTQDQGVTEFGGKQGAQVGTEVEKGAGHGLHNAQACVELLCSHPGVHGVFLALRHTALHALILHQVVHQDGQHHLPTAIHQGAAAVEHIEQVQQRGILPVVVGGGVGQYRHSNEDHQPQGGQHRANRHAHTQGLEAIIPRGALQQGCLNRGGSLRSGRRGRACAGALVLRQHEVVDNGGDAATHNEGREQPGGVAEHGGGSRESGDKGEQIGAAHLGEEAFGCTRNHGNTDGRQTSDDGPEVRGWVCEGVSCSNAHACHHDGSRGLEQGTREQTSKSALAHSSHSEGHLGAGGAWQALCESKQLHEHARCHPSQLLHQPLLK